MMKAFGSNGAAVRTKVMRPEHPKTKETGPVSIKVGSSGNGKAKTKANTNAKEILVTETAGAAADGGTSAFEAAQAAGIREARAEMAAELEQRQLLALQPDDGEESGAAPAPGVGTGAAAAAAAVAVAGAGAGAADGGEPGGTAVAGGAPAQAAMAEAKAWLLLFFNVTEVAVLATPRAARKTSKSSGPRKRKASKSSKPSTLARLNFDALHAAQRAALAALQGSESAARTAVDPGDEFENFFGPVTITITMTTRSYDQYKAGSRGRPRTASEEQGARRGRGENYGAGVSNTGGRHGGVDDATSEADSGSVSRETTPAAGLPLLQFNKLLKKATEASTQRAGENNAVARRLGADAAADAAMAESDGNIANSNNDSDDAELD
eukprot:gene760-12167_t